MQLTQFTDYGLRTLMYVSDREGQVVNVKEISEYFGVSRNHLVKVVHRLSQLGCIETTKGRGGGIRLAEGAENIRLGRLVSQLEPNMRMVECFDAKTNTCRITNACQLKHYLFDATQSFVDSLDQYTVGDINNKTC